LTDKLLVRVKTLSGVIEPCMQPDGRVTVNMGAPVFELAQLPFDGSGLSPIAVGQWQQWPLAFDGDQAAVLVALVSMGNPHAVQVVADVDSAAVASTGALIENHPRFARRVNAGYMQIVSPSQIRLRVYERGAGETLACGTGACAAVVAGIRLGLLGPQVDVKTRGGELTVAWTGLANAPVLLTGPATTVFESEIEVPDDL
jgi:diaminopimelate epimerase